MGLFLNECLFINNLFFNKQLNCNYKERNSHLYRNFHLLPQLDRNKHLKNTATFWKSSREIRNFRPQLSQKRTAKSWGDCIVKWWAHVMSLGKYPAWSMAAVLHVKVQRRPRLLLWPKRGRHVSNMLRKLMPIGVGRGYW